MNRLCLLLGASLAWFASPANLVAADTYANAYARAEKNGEPLLIVVGADWCPACRSMKQSTIPAMERQGKLAGVAVTFVNVDHDGQIASKLMRGGLIPQVVVYQKTGNTWFRRHLTGSQSSSTIASVLSEAKQAAVSAE